MGAHAGSVPLLNAVHPLVIIGAILSHAVRPWPSTSVRGRMFGCGLHETELRICKSTTDLVPGTDVCAPPWRDLGTISAVCQPNPAHSGGVSSPQIRWSFGREK
jgi:hypothetical protein